MSVDPGELRARDPDRWFATLLAPAPVRAAWMACHALDLTLLDLALGTREPMLAEIKLAWWREQLDRLDRAPAPAEPVLAALKAEVLPHVPGAVLARMEDGMLPLALGAELDARAARAHADGRGGTLFAACARLLGAGDTGTARAWGRLWALGELRRIGIVEAADAPALWAVAKPELDALGPKVRGSLGLLKGLAVLGARDLAAPALAPRGGAGRQGLLIRLKFVG